MTPTQQKVLAALLAYGREHGFWPTMDELSEYMGKKSVNIHLNNLEQDGYLCIGRGKSRRVKLRQIEVFGCEFRLHFQDSPEGHRLEALVQAVTEVPS